MSSLFQKDNTIFLTYTAVIICDLAPSPGRPRTLPTAQDPISSSLGSSAPAPAMLPHCRSPAPTSPGAPGCPAPGWGWDGTGCQVLPCCPRDPPPQGAPIPAVPSHTGVQLEPQARPNHTTRVFKKTLASAVPGVVLRVSNFLCSVLTGMAP